MALRLLRSSALSGAGASYLTYRWTSYDNKKTALLDLESRYSQEAQDGLAFLGAQRNYLAAHNVDLTEFMMYFPMRREFPNQFEAPDGTKYLTLALWLDVRRACHKLNGFWDTFIDGMKQDMFPYQSNSHRNPDTFLGPGGDGTPELLLKGRWANRGRNYCDMVEPLERANFQYMKARGVYQKPSRFQVLENAYDRYNQAKSLSVEGKDQAESSPRL